MLQLLENSLVVEMELHNLAQEENTLAMIQMVEQRRRMMEENCIAMQNLKLS